MATRGGSRPGAGRKRLKPEADVADGNKRFATSVLARVGKPGWQEYRDIRRVKNDEDLALHFLANGLHDYDQFNRLLDRKFGKAMQQVRVANPEGEKFKVEVDVTSARDKLIASLLG